MKKNKKCVELLNEFESVKENYFKNYNSKYIINYEIVDDKIKVLSNVGDYRMVKNTKENLSKINHTIIKNKILISKKIDEYEDSSKERFIVLLFNILILFVAGVIVPFTFFMGNLILLVLAIISFSLSVMATSVSGLNYYLLIREIKTLKNLTGYRKDMEFRISDFKLKELKQNN